MRLVTELGALLQLDLLERPQVRSRDLLPQSSQVQQQMQLEAWQRLASRQVSMRPLVL
jgi:hypothetical protein